MTTINVPVWNGQGIRNDWQNIQNAITDVENAGGGTVDLEEGTYIIGTPNPNKLVTINNQPLLLSGNIHIRGKGVGKTILKICDEVNMLAPPLLNDPRRYSGCFFWAAGGKVMV
jgi:hypothetical protein